MGSKTWVTQEWESEFFVSWRKRIFLLFFLKDLYCSYFNIYSTILWSLGSILNMRKNTIYFSLKQYSNTIHTFFSVKSCSIYKWFSTLLSFFKFKMWNSSWFALQPTFTFLKLLIKKLWFEFWLTICSQIFLAGDLRRHPFMHGIFL